MKKGVLILVIFGIIVLSVIAFLIFSVDEETKTDSETKEESTTNPPELKSSVSAIDPEIISPISAMTGTRFELSCDIGTALPCISALHGNIPCEFIKHNETKSIFSCNATEAGTFTNTCSKKILEENPDCNEDKILITEEIIVQDYMTFFDISSPSKISKGESFELSCEVSIGELWCISALHGDNPCEFIEHRGSTSVFSCDAVEEGIFTNTCSKWVWDESPLCNGYFIKNKEIEVIDYEAIIRADLEEIKNMGFDRIRIITIADIPNSDPFSSTSSRCYNDPYGCISFPNPTDKELKNLKKYLEIIDEIGLRYEMVLLMPDDLQEYYNNGINDEDYKKFIDRIWSVIWVGKLDSLVVGGDLTLDPEGINQNENFPLKKSIVDSNRRWLKQMWPYVYEKCPNCNLGINIHTLYGWPADTGVRNIQWIKNEFPNKLPKFIAYQYYPTDKAWLEAVGYRNNEINNWEGIANETYQNLKQVAGDIPLLPDEVSLDLNLGWTTIEQGEFYSETISYFINNGIHFNIWEYADHPENQNTRFGLMNKEREFRPSKQIITNLLSDKKGISAGIQYVPPKMHGWEYINRLNTESQLPTISPWESIKSWFKK